MSPFRLFLALMLACALASAGAAADSKDLKDLKDLEWLAGDWVLVKGKRTIQEQWMKPSGGMMLGMSRTVADGRVIEFEYVRIEQRGDDLFYIAQPNGRPPTEFKLVKSTATEVTFENLQHDFPQQITYTRNADGSVTARIQGPGKNGPRSIAFEYKRPQ